MSNSEGSYLLEKAMFDDFCKQHDDPWEEGFVPTTWTTNDGRTLFLTEMTTDHLQNSINWITDNRTGPHVQIMVAAMKAELKTRRSTCI